MAEFERDIIKERTNAGLAAARSRGRTGGRRKVLTAKEIAMVRQLYVDKKTPVADICRSFHFPDDAVAVCQGTETVGLVSFSPQETAADGGTLGSRIYQEDLCCSSPTRGRYAPCSNATSVQTFQQGS